MKTKEEILKEDIMKLLDSNLRNIQIAKELNTSTDYILQVRKEMGLNRRKAKIYTSPSQKKGMTYSEFSAKTPDTWTESERQRLKEQWSKTLKNFIPN